MLAVIFGLCCQGRLVVPDAFEPGGGWPMLGGNSGHTGQYYGDIRLPMHLLWRFRTKGPIVSSPAVVDGLVCIGSLGKRFYLLSARDGRPYSFLKVGSSISASPAIGVRTVFFGTEFGDDGVYALDLINGDMRWKKDIPDVSASLTLAGRVVFVSSGSGSIHALSTEDGQELWRFQTEGRTSTAAAFMRGMIYLGSAEGFVYALEADTGREAWRRELGGSIWSSPIAHEGHIYVSSFDGKIHALREDDGEVVWSFQTEGDLSSSPAVCHGTVYTGSDNGTLYALNATNGTLNWSFTVGSPILSAPLGNGQVVIFGASNGVLYALDAETGELNWSHRTGRAIVSSPAAWEGRIYVGSMDGYLYAFGAGEEDEGAHGQVIP
ncbi:MAG: hypothetical protein AMJ92_03060 [candidate division Zixibacteria bacterium SM23_81]|nr:MAG: hypothetical protein AMJ92_03060 [candidate division Zixibacteria bacterium SM23_81]